MAADPGITARVTKAAAPYFQGKAVTARHELEGLLTDPAVRADPAALQVVLDTLIETCIRSSAAGCVGRYAGEYLHALPSFPAANAVQRGENARRALYYVDYARYMTFDPRLRQETIAGFAKTPENAFNPGLYLQRLVLKANLRLADGDYAGARDEADRMLSLIASLRNPREQSFVVASALSDAIGILLWTGDTERAYGVYRVSAVFIHSALGERTVDQAAFRLIEAQLLEAMGMSKAASQSLDAVAEVLAQIEVDDEVRVGVGAQVSSLKAVACVISNDLACAETALAGHPLAARFATATAPQNQTEVAYLAARALVAAVSGRADPVAAAALRHPVKVGGDARTQAITEVWRRAGTALADGDGEARREGLRQTGRAEVKVAAAFPGAGFGAWYRPGFVDQLIITLALGAEDKPGREGDEAAFALHQLAARQGGAFDADAMTALGQARDESARRTVHQALRLRARRNRLEREELQKMTERARQPAAGAPLSYDFAVRRTFRDFAVRIDAASRQVSAAGVATSGANLSPLGRFQAALRPGETALTLSAAPGGMVAYMCVRKDRVVRRIAPADMAKAQLDIRLLQSALTAGHAPSEALDSQFPVAAAVRLYDVLIRPFDGCLGPGDDILWLRALSAAPIPLAVLLERAPPKAGAGWDLSAADWLVRRHALAYAGSAGAIVASRSRGARTADFDFLGVGDPILAGTTEQGDDRAKILLRGAGLASLAPLPETRAELENSAKAFSRTRLLVGGEATERDLRSQMIGGYRYLSFATHGLLRQDLQGLSDPALALTPVSATDPANDGLLTASEIADLKLSAGFVALSACNTANIDQTRLSSDLPALASAFAVAGAPATLATLWPVDSQTSQAVVTATFTELGGGQTPARALARAQRAFLTAPPGKAWLHPRFWAPFIILGDGGAAQSVPAAGAASVEMLTTRGGEVLGLKRTDKGLAVRWISDRKETGRHGAGLRLPGWKQDAQEMGATRVLIDSKAHLLAGGYRIGDGKPALQITDKASGIALAPWIGEVRPGMLGTVTSSAKIGPDAWAFAVNQVSVGKTGQLGPVIQLFTVTDGAIPQLLTEIEPPADVSISDVVIAKMGDDLLVAYGARLVFTGPPRGSLDDYDDTPCLDPPVTWLERRDLRTGSQLARAKAGGWSMSSAISSNGKVLVGGAFKAACNGETRAVVGRVGPNLQLESVYADAGLGPSRVEVMVPAIDGRVLVAATKENIYDLRPTPREDGIANYGVKESPISISGMVLSLDRDGKASAPRMLDTGSYIFISAAEASDPKDILIGGAIGDQAAIFHLPGAP